MEEARDFFLWLDELLELDRLLGFFVKVGLAETLQWAAIIWVWAGHGTHKHDS